MSFDVIIIGAGIVGLSTAYNLLEQSPQLKVLILEKEGIEAFHQSGHNSGVIHSGIYYKPNSKKAKNCLKGYQLILDFCIRHQIEYKICGKLLVATDTAELSQLDILFERGIANGLQGLKRLDENQIKDIEPNINGIAAIHVPQAGIVDYRRVASKLKELYLERGGIIQFNERVNNIESKNHEVKVSTDKQVYWAQKLVNCGGLYSDQLAKLSKQKIDHQIVPFRGEYYKLKSNKKHLVNGLVYPVPNPDFPFLGVHLTPTIYGEVECGPNAVLAFRREGYRLMDFNFSEFLSSISYAGFINLAMKYWKTGFKEMYQSISKQAFTKAVQKLLPNISMNDLEKSGSGVRAQALKKDGTMVDDFLIYEGETVINVCNTPSPAATASLAIGEEISSLILK